jgi:asparagine synthase (glutamine-hydrolysing)
MPGLVGYISNNNLENDLLDKMVSSIMHKKWYKVDKYQDPFLNVARVHLGTFNPEPQPIFNEDKTLCIFMDGKIYGYEDRMNELKKNGHKFYHENDAEYCLHSFEEYGGNIFKNLNGYFFIIIYNLNDEKVLIANDRYGHIPYYRYTDKQGIFFSPEIKAILETDCYKPEIKNDVLINFLTFNKMRFGNSTIFKNIEVIPPATMFEITPHRIRTKQYWELKFSDEKEYNEEKIVHNLVKAFLKATNERIKGYSKIGLSLSGGLDSRAILASIKGENLRKTITFTYGMPDCDELKIAQKVARIAKTEHRFFPLYPENFIKHANIGMRIQDELDIFVLAPQEFIGEQLRGKIDVILQGVDLDVTLGGEYLDEKIVCANSDNELMSEVMKRLIVFPEEMLLKLFKNEFHAIVKQIPRKSLNDAFRNLKSKEIGDRYDEFLILNSMRRIIMLRYKFIRVNVEPVSPVYDNNFIEIILKIPPKFRMNHYIFRKFFIMLSKKLSEIDYQRTMLPPIVPTEYWNEGRKLESEKEKLYRNIWVNTKDRVLVHYKRYYTNFDEWIRTDNELKNFINETLLSESTLSTKKYFNKDYIKQLIDEHQTGKENHMSRIIYLLSFELFLRLFFAEEFNKEIDNYD